MPNFFPQVQIKPISVEEALQDIKPDYIRLPHPGQQWAVKLAKPGESLAKYHPHGYWFSYIRLPKKQPSPTLQKSQSDKVYHYADDRVITIKEAARLASFPDAFQFVGKHEDAWERIGNTVPPRFMLSIAEHRYAQLLRAFHEQEFHAMPLDFIDKPINPDTPRLFTVISLFSGAGGSSLGYIWAGGKVLAAVEWDDNAVATYRLNFPDTPIFHRDIATVTTEELLALTGLQPRELDILDGSPPCQGLSTAGKRQFDDPRNSLFKEYVRLLRGLQPKVFVMENVSGMVKGNMKHIFALIMRELKSSGYQVKCQLMNAMYFGVPQSRERVIFIGVRKDLKIEPDYPEAQSMPHALHEALENAPQDMPAPSLSGKFGALSCKLTQGQSIQDLTGSYGHGNARLKSSLPSPTLVKTAIFGAPKMIHPTEDRGFSIGEARRIASFPDAFRFIGDWENAWARIGNSVPPRFMESIASHLYEHILSKAVLLSRLEEVSYA